MDREQIRLTLVELLEHETGEKPQSVADSISLREQMGLDSLDLVGLVMQVESRYHIRLTHQELEKVVKIGDFLDLVEAKLAELPPSAVAA